MSTDLRARIERAGDLALEVRDVDPVIKRAAEMAATLACRRLGIPSVRVRWLPAATSDRRGCTYPSRPDEIWVRVQDHAGVVETTSHEVRHAWQIRQWGPGPIGDSFDSMEHREDDARAFGLKIRAELTGG